MSVALLGFSEVESWLLHWFLEGWGCTPSCQLHGPSIHFHSKRNHTQSLNHILEVLQVQSQGLLDVLSLSCQWLQGNY